MRRITALLLATLLLLATTLPVRAEQRSFRFMFLRDSKIGAVGDVQLWTWKFEPLKGGSDDLPYLHVYLYPGAELVDLEADGAMQCAPLPTGFGCTGRGMTAVTIIEATIKLVGPGEMVDGRQLYGRAIGGAYGNNTAQHIIEVQAPTNLEPADEPFRQVTYLPLMQGE